MESLTHLREVFSKENTKHVVSRISELISTKRLGHFRSQLFKQSTHFAVDANPYAIFELNNKK